MSSRVLREHNPLGSQVDLLRGRERANSFSPAYSWEAPAPAPLLGRRAATCGLTVVPRPRARLAITHAAPWSTETPWTAE